jgi:hypothetical protein
VLQDARAALGGEQKITAVKSFTATGRTRRVQGDNLVPIEFEIAAELPDKYIRKDEIPAQESDPSTNGYNGDALVQVPPPSPPAGREGAPPPPPAQFEAMLKQRATTFKQDFARLMLGMFASSYPAYPLTWRYIGQAEAPQGKAHVLEGTGPGNFTIRYFVNMETHLPVMVSWQATARPAPARGGPPPPGAAAHGAPPPGPPPTAASPPAGAPPAGAPSTPPAPPGSPATPPAAPARGGPPPGMTSPVTGQAPPAPGGARGGTTPPENRLYFADYRDVDGLKLPFRLRRAVGADTTEETTFDRFRINPKIDPRRFEVRR